jgi:hypothetical protein
MAGIPSLTMGVQETNVKNNHYDAYDEDNENDGEKWGSGWGYEEDSQFDDDYHVELIDLDKVKPLSEDDDVSQFDLSRLPRSKHVLFDWQRSITRRQVRSFITICLVLMLIGVGLVSVFGGTSKFVALGTLITGKPKLVSPNNHHSQNLPMNIAASKILTPQSQGFVCLSDTAWSPDSRYLAMVGYRRTCLLEGMPNGIGMVAVYNTITGQPVTDIQIDGPVQQALQRLAPHLGSSPILNYTQVLWSPRGNRLAIPFTVQLKQVPGSQISYVTVYNGLVLMNEDGSDIQVLLHAQSSNASSAEWDLARQAAMPDPAVLAEDSPKAAALSPSTMYMWGANGSLIAEQFGDSQSSSLIPIGNPMGGYAFTIWQPGVVILNNILADGAATTGPPVYTLDSNFGAWSPDGRYLISIQIESRLEYSGEQQPTQQALTALDVSQLPLLQVRDQALQQVLETLSSPTAPSNLDMISWRPDGDALAVYDASSTSLNIYDCLTGYQIDSLLLSSKPFSANLNGTYMLRWSPNGKHLMLFDPDAGNIILWNVPA